MDNQPPNQGQKEINLQGMSPAQIAELFKEQQSASETDFPELGASAQGPGEVPAEPAEQQPEPEKASSEVRGAVTPETPAEAIEQLPEFSAEQSGWREKISSRREAIRQQLAGVDPVPPKSGMVLQADPNDPFIQLLRPLPQSEILALSAEVAQDDTIFDQVERQRRNQFRSHNLAAILTALALAIFALAVGPQFITDTLLQAKIPGWVPTDWPEEGVSGALFVTGLLALIGAGMALLDGLRWLLAASGGSGLKTLSMAFPGLLSGPLALLLLAQGSVLSAVVVLIIYWAVTVVISTLEQSKRYKKPPGGGHRGS